MATVSFLTGVASTSSSASATTPASVTATVADGDWLLVGIAATNGGASGAASITTVTDSTGVNVYTQRALINYNPSGVGSGATLALYTAPVISNITSGTVTGNFSPNTSQKVVSVARIRPDVGAVISFVTADTTGATGSATNHNAPASVSVNLGEVIFGVAAIKTNDPITLDTDTLNGSWDGVAALIADGGTDATAMGLCANWKFVTGSGSQSWSASTTSARNSARTYLILKVAAAAYSIATDFGAYTLSGTAATLTLGHSLVAGAGSYALTGTAATFINTATSKTIAADVGSYDMLGVDATLTHGYKLDATIAGSYALTGTDATLRRALPMVADAGSYSLLGTDATLTKASTAAKVLGVDSGSYVLTGTDATPKVGFKVTVDVGSYVLTGSAAALVTAANKVILADPESYALTGTDAALTAGVAPPSVSPLHIGEWPVDKRKRRRREDAAAAEQRARKRFRDAIGRLLEGLPPEFDEPADLDEALDNAVQAANLLYALSAPIREINAVNELIDHIRQLRIAQPIAQLHLAQAYNQAHRHLMAKAQEDTVLTLLLGE